MCGFAGFFGRRTDTLEKDLNKMGDAIRHRGPDDGGIWLDRRAGIGLVHRRLSIIDLTSQGHQPMVSGSGRRVLAYNGEIYNFKLLRLQLEKEGCAFNGNSDTEVLLVALEVWGVLGTLKKLNGMFAFALWDCRDHKLVLARDRLGEKPLYYGKQKGTFVFGSELKALMAMPGFQKDISPDALALYLRFGYVPAPYSIFTGIQKLQPGTFVEIDSNENIEEHIYWSADDCIKKGKSQVFQGDEKSAMDMLDALLQDAVSLRMEADVPLGGFLSGGIDSSIVVAMMQAASSRSVKTFTVGFHDPQFNEAEQAALVADHLKTDHTEIYLKPDDALRVIPGLPELFDEPFADESQIPTYLVAKTARDFVTVALSGDGGDEVFAGYNRHIVGGGAWNQIQSIPRIIRLGVGGFVHLASNPSIIKAVSILFPGSRVTAEKISKLEHLLTSSSSSDAYLKLISHWGVAPLNHKFKSREQNEFTVLERVLSNDLSKASEKMMAADLKLYLPDDILVKLDRALMGVSLEGRIPLLDHRVVELGWKIPLGLKIRNGQGKWLLRQLLYRYVPEGLVNRPKMGFNVPLSEWLRGSLFDWANELLAEKNIKSHGMLDYEAVNKVWQSHLSGKRNYSQELWTVLMFQAWYQRWI